MAKHEEILAAIAVLEVGNAVKEHIDKHSCVNKDTVVMLLRKAEDAFPFLGQSASLKSKIEPLSNSLVRSSLLQHKDKDIRVLVANCLCQIIRVFAPDLPYNDKTLREIFALIISMFQELSDTKSPYFTRRVKILETIARLKCCVIMMDIGCDDLVLEMFNIFFSAIREHHQQSLLHSMISIMTLILKGKVSWPLLDVILRNLLKEEKGAAPAHHRLAVSVLQDCTETLEPSVREFLTSAILDIDSVESELKEHYHEIILEISQCAPKMLLSVIPSLSHELLIDQVDVRIKAVNLLGKLFALPGQHVVQEYPQLFVEFLKRFSDKSAEVRISALQCAKACYPAIPSGTETLQMLASLEGGLQDIDDKVRIQAVITICDLAKSNMKCIPPELILHAMECIGDKKVLVRKNTMQKLLELYRDYRTQRSEGLVTVSDHLEQIPCKILTLCYDEDCKEFRLQDMELVLGGDLFPPGLSVKERMRHWFFLFSVFTSTYVKETGYVGLKNEGSTCYLNSESVDDSAAAIKRKHVDLDPSPRPVKLMKPVVDWGGLPPELLDLISQHFSIPDLIEFASTCPLWYDSALTEFKKYFRPWLVLLMEEDDHTLSGTSSFIDAFDLIEGHSCSVRKSRGKFFCGLLRGLIYTCSPSPDDNYSLIVEAYSPATGASRHSSSFYNFNKESLRVLSCSSLNATMVMAILGSQLFYFTEDSEQGSEQGSEWIHVDRFWHGKGYYLQDVRGVSMKDVIFHQKEFFALDLQNGVSVFDDIMFPIITQEISHPSLAEVLEVYLLESEEHLYMVSSMTGKRIRICRLDKCPQAYRWSNVCEIGERSFFCCKNNSFSISSSQYPGSTRNIVYLIGSFGRTDEICTYSLDTGMVQALDYAEPGAIGQYIWQNHTYGYKVA